MNKNLLLFGALGLAGYALWKRTQTGAAVSATIPGKSLQTSGDALAPGLFGLFSGWGAPKPPVTTKPKGGDNNASTIAGAAVNAFGKLLGVLKGGSGGSVSPIAGGGGPGRVASRESVAQAPLSSPTSYVGTEADVPAYQAAIQIAEAEQAKQYEGPSRQFGLYTDDFAAPSAVDATTAADILP